MTNGNSESIDYHLDIASSGEPVDPFAETDWSIYEDTDGIDDPATNYLGVEDIFPELSDIGGAYE